MKWIEKIKAMGIEEMAEWINQIEYECHLACKHQFDCYGYRSEEYNCLQSIKLWLESESEDADNE